MLCCCSMDEYIVRPGSSSSRSSGVGKDITFATKVDPDGGAVARFIANGKHCSYSFLPETFSIMAAFHPEEAMSLVWWNRVWRYHDAANLIKGAFRRRVLRRRVITVLLIVKAYGLNAEQVLPLLRVVQQR